MWGSRANGTNPRHSVEGSHPGSGRSELRPARRGRRTPHQYPMLPRVSAYTKFCPGTANSATPAVNSCHVRALSMSVNARNWSSTSFPVHRMLAG